MTYRRPADADGPEPRPDEPDDDPAVAEWVARHLAAAPPLSRAQRARIAYRLANRGAA